MSDPQAQLQEVEDLEASVDALMQDIEASSERVERQVRETSGESTHTAAAAPADPGDDAEFADFESAHAALGGEVNAPGVDAPEASAGLAVEMDASKSALDALLGGAAEELEEPLPPALAPPVPAPEAATSAEPALTTDPGTAAIDDIDAAFASVETLNAATAKAATPAPTHSGTEDPSKRAELESRANQPPIGDIEELDKALAHSAEAVMAEAQRTPPTPEPAPASPPAPEPVVKAPEPVPAHVAVAAATVAAAEAVAVEPKPNAKPKLAAVLAPIGRVTTAALMPLNSLHAKLPESTRQTVAYIAIMNVFFASVVWFMALRPRPEAEVSYDVKAIYLTEQAAREAEREARAKAEAESKKGGHGEAKKDDGHGGAKKDDGHGGGGGHGEAKKPAKKDAGHGEAKKPDKKAAAKKDAGHGGGGH